MARLGSEKALRDAISLVNAKLMAQQSVIELALVGIKDGSMPREAIDVLESLGRMVAENQDAAGRLRRAWEVLAYDITMLPNDTHPRVWTNAELNDGSGDVV